MSIIPENSFLRKLPVGLSLEQRMKFDGIRIAAEIIALSNNRLIGIALHIAREEKLKPSNTSMTALQVDVWSIINNCHIIRKILQSSPEIKTEAVTSFLEATKDVSEVRDAHHHYYSQLKNRTQKKRKTAPLYGAISWTYGDGEHPKGIYFVTCWMGAMHEPKLGIMIPNFGPDGIRLPIGKLHLEAFDYKIDLQNITDAVSSLVQHLNTEVSALVHKKLEAYATEQNLDREKLNENVAADIFIALWGEFSDPTGHTKT